MKKVLLLFTLFAFFFLGVYAQYWNLTGNAGTPPPTNFIGTTDNVPLVFKTYGTERMRLLEDRAFLGIGIPTPLATLHLHNSQKSVQLPLLQLTTAATGNAANNGFAVYSDNNTKDIYFRQHENAGITINQ